MGSHLRKKQALGKCQRNTLLVYIPRLDENVLEAYNNRLIERSNNPIPAKEERSYIFADEIDLDDSEHGPSYKSDGPSQGYCSPFPEIKLQRYSCNPTEDQENVGRPYLCNLVQESADLYPYFPENIQPPLAVEMCDAGTQTLPKNYKYVCECLSLFNNRDYYEQHKMIHASVLCECAFCNATFTSRKELGHHLLLHKSTNYFECLECECIFSNKKHLIKHIMRTHKKNSFECAECKAQFNTIMALQIHKKTHASSGKMIHVFRRAKVPIKPTADVVVVETKTANAYEEPQAYAQRFFQCSVCHLQFRTAGKLEHHSDIHNRTAAHFSHFCSVCGGRFRTKTSLICHKRCAHNS